VSTWTEHEPAGTTARRRWTLDADPRYSVERAGVSDYRALIDGHEVDGADSAEGAQAQLEVRYEYEQHASDLALARTRLRQARQRLLDRYPRAARDGKLSSILDGLGDALGAGPELDVSDAQPRKPGLFARQVTPELVAGTDSSQCVVLLVGGAGHRDPVRTVTVPDVDALKAALDDARAVQHGAEVDRQRHRRASGRLTQAEALEWLTGPRGWSGVPGTAAQAVADMRAGQESLPALAAADEGMTYDSTYWVIPAEQG
jgi:hypothetical protein